MKKTYRCINGEMVLVSDTTPSGRTPGLLKPFEPMRSPIDGRLLRNRSDLAAHNREHGVTNDPDSLREQTERAIKARAKPYVGSREERREAVARAIEQHFH